MTRKDYQEIARAINNSRSTLEFNQATIEVVAVNIASVMQANNVRFDRDRFLTACGVKS